MILKNHISLNENMKIINKDFFKVSVLELAHKLLGKIIVHSTEDNDAQRFRITEVEAYGMEDSACHAYKGKTKRNAPMFEEGGIVYVYLCYGIFNILNIVSGEKDSGEGVMIRGINDIFGPGKASRAMGITRNLNYEDLTISNKIWIEDDGFIPNKIAKFTRVGIGYALKQDQDKLWRFRLID
ncbi:MAG: DNA-3-methyladenine glycosylase [Defluviitaleaceae bacterium]|nr:DNA-3-methyladenine glycosylase [Defluviitaleaceae bacterium]